MPLRELWLERRWARQRQRERLDRDVTRAWYVQRIKMGVKREGERLVLGPLKDFLPSLDKQRATADRQVAMLYQVAAQHGLKVQVTNTKGSHGDKRRHRQRTDGTRGQH